MIPKSGYRFSEKIMLKQQAKAKYRLDLKPYRFSALLQCSNLPAGNPVVNATFVSK